MGSVLLDGKTVGWGGWLARYAAPYEEVASWGQAVKGDIRGSGVPEDWGTEAAAQGPDGRSREAVAREVARRWKLSVEKMRSPGQGRPEALGRALVAWAGREVGGLSIARAARYFSRDTILDGQSRSTARRADRHLPRTSKIQRRARRGAPFSTCHLGRATSRSRPSTALTGPNDFRRPRQRMAHDEGEGSGRLMIRGAFTKLRKSRWLCAPSGRPRGIRKSAGTLSCSRAVGSRGRMRERRSPSTPAAAAPPAGPLRSGTGRS
jgi:hypothetical protein